MLIESCTGGHGVSKSSWDPKNVDFSPRKRPEMLEITSFDDAARVVYRGSRGIKILPREAGISHVLELFVFMKQK